MSAERLDQAVVRLGFAKSREKAQRLIRAGAIRVNDQVRDKPGQTITAEDRIEAAAAERFVSRGGEKLEEAFRQFHLDVEGLTCADIGSSTGGFTDCLLQHGAARVFAVDVGKGQLHWKIREDERVTVMEGINARHLPSHAFDPRPTFAVVDVSFISLQLILPPVRAAMADAGTLITLIKPQFEAGRDQVGKGGVVRDPGVHEAVIERIRQFGIMQANLNWRGVCPSPIKGPAGNTEFLAWWTWT